MNAASELTLRVLPISQLVIRTAESALGPVIKLPTMGGSVPLYMISQILHAPTITTPIANHDNNQHSSDENIRLETCGEADAIGIDAIPVDEHLH